MTIFDYTRKPMQISKPIRLIELFAGYGSQAMALERLGANFEHYLAVEIDKYAIASYNAVHGTSFPAMDITKITGADLKITDTDKYCYIMTYSFPCTDLSIAGRQMGMEEGSGTRSSLLWEVRRLLTEAENLPQVLLMENVPQVHGDDNIVSFKKWLSFLEQLGYSNYVDDLNAMNYGIPQSRERCFVVSILGNYNYKFPNQIKLKTKMKDMFEEDAQEKYYLNTEKAQKLIDKLIDSGTLGRQADRQTGLITYNLCRKRGRLEGNSSDVAGTVMARCYKGIENFGGTAVAVERGTDV